MGIAALGKNDFLNLLTKQLQFQDPLKPMDSTAFVAQLAQFSALESALETNKTLGTLVQGNASMANMGAANLLGRKVSVSGEKVTHQSGKSENILYQLEADASQVAIQVLDANGKVVKTLTAQGTLTKGASQILWDGTDNQGDVAKEGQYTYVGVAKGSDGKFTDIKLGIEGEVTGVSYGEGGPFVTVDGTEIPVVKITKILK